MRDALLLHKRPPRETVIFAVRQLQGTRESQEDYVVHVNDECFVVCDGVGGLPHGEVAAKLAGDTAVWAYRLVRQRRTYWKGRKLLLKRIFRTTNITLWQKQREEGFTDGMATTMLVAIIIDRHYYIGSVGDSSAFLVHDGKMVKLTTEDVDPSGRLTKVMGTMRYGLSPSIVAGDIVVGDTLMLATDGVASVSHATAITTLLEEAGNEATGLADVAKGVLLSSEKKGVTDNMTVCLVKRIA